jgi:hypothetical protein
LLKAEIKKPNVFYDYQKQDTNGKKQKQNQPTKIFQVFAFCGDK